MVFACPKKFNHIPPHLPFSRAQQHSPHFTHPSKFPKREPPAECFVKQIWSLFCRQERLFKNDGIEALTPVKKNSPASASHSYYPRFL